MKKRIYVDMDGVVADYEKAKLALNNTNHDPHEGKVPEGFFRTLEVIEGAVEALTELSKYYDVHFLSTPQWSNPFCWMEKRIWVEEVFGDLMFKRLTLTHDKSLLKGDYLIDDRTTNGVDRFEGEHIHFGAGKFQTWKDIINYLLPKCEYCKTVLSKGNTYYHTESECNLSYAR